MRLDGRTSTQLRLIKITPNYTKHAMGSVLIETGDTKVICTVSVEENTPKWMKTQQPNAGWLTSEYSMLPSATGTRNRRERDGVSGRTQEIQRLIGRSLRGIFDLSKCPGLTFMVDCDVIQADGGTRTASITGSYVALKIAVDKLLRQGKLKSNPITGAVAAVSIGVKDDKILVDLDYSEDSTADLDMNVVMRNDKEILELQGTAENKSFNKQQVMDIIDVATEALTTTFELQAIAADGHVAEG